MHEQSMALESECLTHIELAPQCLGLSDPPESWLLALRLLALGLVVLVCAVTDGPS